MEKANKVKDGLFRSSTGYYCYKSDFCIIMRPLNVFIVIVHITFTGFQSRKYCVYVSAMHILLSELVRLSWSWFHNLSSCNSNYSTVCLGPLEHIWFQIMPLLSIYSSSIKHWYAKWKHLNSGKWTISSLTTWLMALAQEVELSSNHQEVNGGHIHSPLRVNAWMVASKLEHFERLVK